MYDIRLKSYSQFYIDKLLLLDYKTEKFALCVFENSNICLFESRTGILVKQFLFEDPLFKITTKKVGISREFSKMHP